MFPFFKPLEDITEGDLDLLMTDMVSEGKTLDYKKETYGPKDSDKKEFAKDVSAFANASGGYIIIGIDEDKGVPTAVDGISIDPDAEILRLDAVAKTGINPRIPRLPLRAIPLENGKFVIIIQIPKSWNSPHMVTYKGHNRFYARNSSGKYELDVNELRTAFTLSTSIAERVRNFRVDRIGKIMAGDTPASINHANPALVLHVVPLVGVSGRQNLDVKSFNYDKGENARLLHKLGEIRFNLDGVLCYAGNLQNPVYDYCQVFRNGSIEYVFPNIGQRQDNHGLLSVGFEDVCIDFLRKAHNLIDYLTQGQPYYLFLTLLRVINCSLERPRGVHFSGFVPNLIDRDILLIPEIGIEESSEDFPTLMRPAFDAIWNAAGFPSSLQYDHKGNWKPDQR